MKLPKSALTMLAGAAFMAGMTLTPVTVPRANAQIDIHLGWQEPPHEYNDIQRQGFHAGIDAARHDMDHGLPPDPHRHDDFRRPHVPPNLRDDFRHGFQHGYETAYQHRGDWNHEHHDWDDHHDGH